MAGLTRKTSIAFGNAGPTTSFGQFGSKEAGTPQTSQDPAVIQGLPGRWQQGWQTAVVSSDKAAYIEDMNGYCLVQSYQITYLFQMGIPEWDSATLYFTGSIVQTQSNQQQFKSLQGGTPGTGLGQSGNPPPASASNAFWLWINPPQDLVGSATLNTVPKVTNVAPSNGIPGSVVLGDSALSDDGVNVKTSLPIKFPDNTIQSTAAISSNAVTVQSPPSAYVVTPTRTIGSTYQNTGSKPLFVLISITQSNPTETTGYVDGNSFPSTVVAVIGIGSGNVPGISYSGTMFFIVLPGYYYRTSGGTLTAWTEWT